MATFKGFSTINRPKRYSVTDLELIKQDLLNAFNIKPGELPGRPAVGSTIWSLLFENFTEDTANSLTREIEKTIAIDPRLALDDVQIFNKDNGVLIELSVVTVPGTTVETLQIFFDQSRGQARFV